MRWVKDGFELAGTTGCLYIFYRGFMGVAYEALDWFLTKCGYPSD